MEKAFSNSHKVNYKELGVKEGEKIPEKKLKKAEHSDKSGQLSVSELI